MFPLSGGKRQIDIFPSTYFDAHGLFTIRVIDASMRII